MNTNLVIQFQQVVIVCACLVLFFGQALEIMVRQMNQHDHAVVQAVLGQLQHSPVWKHRKEAARQLIHLGEWPKKGPVGLFTGCMNKENG